MYGDVEGGELREGESGVGDSERRNEGQGERKEGQ